MTVFIFFHILLNFIVYYIRTYSKGVVYMKSTNCSICIQPITPASVQEGTSSVCKNCLSFLGSVFQSESDALKKI